MKSTFRTLFYLRKDRVNADGLVPIMVRITINSQMTQFSSKLEVNPNLLQTNSRRVIDGRFILFTNDYHLKPDSLILSASIDGKPMETIELSISEMKILQCTGVCNQNSEYHTQILNLVERNISQIQKRLAA